jgi:hypothetical protein
MKPMPASRCSAISGGEFDVDAERGQHVGRARLRGERAVAVLGDRHARAGDDEGGAGGDVVGAGRVAAGADDVDGVGRRFHGSILARMVMTAPVISSTVSPRTRSAMRKPPICAGVASPDIMMSKAARASSTRESGAGRDLADHPFGSRSSAACPALSCLRPRRVRCGRGQEVFQNNVWPCSDAMLSGGTARRAAAASCDSAMITPSSVSAVTSSSGEALAGRRSANDSASPRKDRGCRGTWARRVAMRSACRASAPARARPCRRRPGRWPGGRGRRRRSARRLWRRDEVEADAGLVRRARARRQHDGVGPTPSHLADADRVVACTTDLGPELAEVVAEVPGEAVVVVDED